MNSARRKYTGTVVAVYHYGGELDFVRVRVSGKGCAWVNSYEEAELGDKVEIVGVSRDFHFIEPNAFGGITVSGCIVSVTPTARAR